MRRTHTVVDEQEVEKRARRALQSKMKYLDLRTGRRLGKQDRVSMAASKLPTRPQATDKWASALGVDRHLYRKLGLETIRPKDLKDEISDLHAQKSDRRKVLEQEKWKELDRIILSGEPYDLTRFSKDQYSRRRKKLLKAGVDVPVRRKGRRKN